MRASPLALLALLSCLAPAAAVADLNHCLSRAKITPVPGNPRAVQIETAHARTVAYYAERVQLVAAPDFIIQARDTTYEGDGDTKHLTDHLIIPVGSSVRWQWITGFHTLTNGLGDGDPAAGTTIEKVLADTSPVFDTTFAVPTHLDYYCRIHENTMHGIIDVLANTSVTPHPQVTRATFSRAPAPNPTRDAMACAVTVPSAENVEITVHDLAGRRVALLFSGRLEPGEHPFRWDGVMGSRGRAPAGIYRVRLRAGDIEESRSFSLIR